MSVKNTRKKNAIRLALMAVVLVATLASLAVWIMWMDLGAKPVGAPGTVVPEIVAPHKVDAPKLEQRIITVDLTGKWVATLNGTTFTVIVANSNVDIMMTKNGSSLLYWHGTFSNSGTVGEPITSTKLDIDKPVLSGADSKVFSVKNDKLAFEVSAMGQTKTVEVVHV